jgi:hypothetical protein
VKLRLAPLFALTLFVLAAGVQLATAERSGRGGVVVSLDGSISPRYLPRHHLAPVFITISGSVARSNSAPLPQLAGLDFAFGGPNGLETAGLPLCPRAELRASELPHALSVCGPALVGRGRLQARIEFPGQPPNDILARLLAFNGRTSSGDPAVWLLVDPYRPDLPSSFVLAFRVQPATEGTYGVFLRARISQTLGRWWRLRSFRLTIGRRYRADGVRHSYLKGRCPLPPRFHVAPVPLARATFHFSPRPVLPVAILRGCRVRD